MLAMQPPDINLSIALPTAAPTEAEGRAAELEEEEGAKLAIASRPAGPPRPGRGRSMRSQISHRLTEDASLIRSKTPPVLDSGAAGSALKKQSYGRQCLNDRTGGEGCSEPIKSTCLALLLKI